MRYVLILLLLATPAYADDLARATARKAAEAAEKDAHATKDIAKYVACGNAYLDIYNQFPGPDGDEPLYNAGICFGEGKSIGAAIQVFELLMRTFPTSKLVPRALARTAMLYAHIAMFDKAAAKLEEYASKYAAEKDAFDALSDATYYRRGLGDRERTIKNTHYFVKTYGRKKPKEAAQAMIALTSAYEQDPEQQSKHLREILRAHKLDDDQKAVVHAKLGDALSAQSCPVRLVDGLCIKLERDRGDAKTRCATAIPRVVVVKRTAAHQDAVAAYEVAAKLFDRLPKDAYGQHSAAMARLALADVELERLIGLTFPTGLDFNPDPKRATARKRSLDKFNTWLSDTTKQAQEATKRYEAVLALKEPHSSLVAAARIGQTGQAFWRALRVAEIPKDVRTGPAAKDSTAAFCKQLDETSAPLATRAAEAFEICLTKAAELGVHDAYTRMCLREGQVVDAPRFPPRDLHPDPVAITIPMVPDKIGEPDWRAGKHDVAIKAWEVALKQNAKLFAPRINLAIARYEQLRVLPATDASRKQLIADITQHAQSALAVENDPTAYVVLAALALDNPKQYELAHVLLRHSERASTKYAPTSVALGVLAVRRDQWSAALAHFERAATLDPKSEPVQLALALAYLRVGRYDAAATKLAVLKTVSYDVELARGVAARGLGKRDEAKAAYERAIKLDASRPEARHNLSLLAKPAP